MEIKHFLKTLKKIGIVFYTSFSTMQKAVRKISVNHWVKATNDQCMSIKETLTFSPEGF